MSFILMGITLVSAVAVDNQQSIMRRDGGAIELGSKGNLVHVAVQKREKDDPLQFCELDYPVGKVGENGCKQSNHSKITQRAECRDAANEAGGAGAGAPEDTIFVLDETWYNRRPLDCFALDCSEHADSSGKEGICYFMNESPYTPDAIEAGTPVCSRPKYANGTSVPNGIHNGCPGGYEPIQCSTATSEGAASTCNVQHGDACQIAAQCLGEPAATGNFRVGISNASEHNDFPLGCHFNLVDNKVYFNFVATGFESPSRAAPETAVPICVVSSTTSW